MIYEILIEKEGIFDAIKKKYLDEAVLVIRGDKGKSHFAEEIQLALKQKIFRFS
jgi:hypothetical protein